MSVDPYQVLGVPYNADEDEIKKKYRSLVKQYHPDLHPNDPEAARKMSEINAAYEMIKSGEAKAYRGGSSNSGGQSASGGYTGAGAYQYGDMDDFLNSFFSSFGFGTAASQMNENEAYERVSRYLAEGDLDSAASLLNRMVMRSSRWYYYAAQLSSMAGEYREAVRYADEARRQDPSDPEYAELSAEYHKRYDAAIRRSRIMPTILSIATFSLAVIFILRMLLSLFGWMFIF
ncbi:MAG: DnaJ domain-containing protein [Oscillospiraceae bacterium]|nr:DnaJ domain-containing protein [Oscillospiraceae bacterium]